ncbi:hypothetical protein C8T65DRAFT_561051, partial [Cerioporus squamosus]
AFLPFVHNNVRHECALVEWFELHGNEPGSLTGKWMVEPELHHGERVCVVIPVNSIMRASYLIGTLYGHTKVPIGFSYSDSLD